MELSETEKFWITRCVNDYLSKKSDLMNPKDRNILTTLLGKLTIAERAYKVKIEIERW